MSKDVTFRMICELKDQENDKWEMKFGNVSMGIGFELIKPKEITSAFAAAQEMIGGKARITKAKYVIEWDGKTKPSKEVA